MKKFTWILLITLFIMLNCEKQSQGPSYDSPEALTATNSCDILTTTQIDSIKAIVHSTPNDSLQENEIAVLETSLGQIKIEFFPTKAPNHCANFKRLITSGFFKCTYFHRVLQDFVIQGGDINTRDNSYRNDGTGNPGYTIDAEFNNIEHDLGILSMARSNDPNSAGSQFFICLSREYTFQLDGSYTAFGRVIEGLEVVQAIGQVPVTMNDHGEVSQPLERIFILDTWMEEK